MLQAMDSWQAGGVACSGHRRAGRVRQLRRRRAVDPIIGRQRRGKGLKAGRRAQGSVCSAVAVTMRWRGCQLTSCCNSQRRQTSGIWRTGDCAAFGPRKVAACERGEGCDTQIVGWSWQALAFNASRPPGGEVVFPSLGWSPSFEESSRGRSGLELQLEHRRNALA